MPVSSTEPGPQSIAITAQALFLINLMLAPVLGFVLLVLYYLRHRGRTEALALSHLQQTLSASLWGGVLLVAACLALVLIGGADNAWTWVVVIIYFTFCHSSLILFGIVGLAKAMAGRCWRYPLVGWPLPPGCESP